MKKFRWQILIVVLALIAFGILLIGQQPTILPGVAPVIEAEPGGEYAEALVGSLGRLNPVLRLQSPRPGRRSSGHEILVMADGAIIERGTLAQLLEQGGAYADLYQKQFQDPGGTADLPANEEQPA